MTEDSRTTEALLARRELAEKATPGPWGQVIAGLERVVIDSKGTVICTVCLDEDFSDKETERQVLANLYYIAVNSPAIVMADIDEILRLRTENEKLRKSVEIQRGMVQEAYQTAALAWGGEIPSPLPGHTRMTEEEADWLAENCWKKPEVEYHPLREMRGGFFCDACRHDYDCRKCWREAARKAVEANHD